MDDFIYVYHGSNQKVENPDAEYNKDHFSQLDFGTGFYTTDNPELARMWAIAKMKGNGNGVVARYKFYINRAIANCSFIDFGGLND